LDAVQTHAVADCAARDRRLRNPSTPPITTISPKAGKSQTMKFIELGMSIRPVVAGSATE
jgi:hypothetical protein